MSNAGRHLFVVQNASKQPRAATGSTELMSAGELQMGLRACIPHLFKDAGLILHHFAQP